MRYVIGLILVLVLVFGCSNGEVVDDLGSYSVNCKGRIPLFRPDGSLVLRWQKDEEGNRIGDAPVSLQSDHSLVWSTKPTLIE